VYGEFRNIKNDILNVNDNNLTSLKKYHKWINEHKYDIIPKKDSFSKNSIPYDICCKPQDYLKCMIYINKELEKLGTFSNPVKLFHALPLRTSIVSKYVTFDTASIVYTIIRKNAGNYISNIKLNQNEIWTKHFNFKKRAFKKKGYQFNYMIKTDGVSCSILFVKLNSDNKPMKILSFKQKQLRKNKEIIDKQYIENQDVKKLLHNKNYVCIDPNMSDLMYCMDKKEKYLDTHKTKEGCKLEIRNT
jgi:hypothetical protein